MAAGVAPQSSCTFNPHAPASSCSTKVSGRLLLPLASSPTLTGNTALASSIRAMFHGPGVHVVPFEPSAGPVPPPINVVTPLDNACGTWAGVRKCTWASIAAGVDRLLTSTQQAAFDSGDEGRVRQPEPVAGRRAIERGVLLTGDRAHDRLQACPSAAFASVSNQSC